MTQNLKTVSITSLRWTLGLVVLLESIHFTISASVASHFATMNFPLWSRSALGGSEILAALFFLTPTASLIGGYFLLIVFAVAIALHFSRAEFDAGNLLIYAAAAFVCISHRNTQPPGSAN